MALTKSWDDEVIRLKQQILDVKRYIREAEDDPRYQPRSVGFLRWRRDMREWIDRMQDLVDNGPWRPDN